MIQKPFSSRLLVLTSKRVLGFVLFALSLTSCSFNPPLQGKGSEVLQGEWQQDSIGNTSQLVNYTRYRFRFSCDSVFIRMENFSKVNYGTDTCMNKGHWFEYAGATYGLKNNALHIKGFYCDDKYRLKEPGGCFSYGVYENTFRLTFKGDSDMVLLPASTTLPIQLKRIKKWACVPKPL
jgi:hypothetical protein